MPSIDVLNSKREVVGSLQLSDELFGEVGNTHVVWEVVRHHLGACGRPRSGKSLFGPWQRWSHLGQAFAKQTLRLPIRGTLTQPKLDQAALPIPVEEVDERNTTDEAHALLKAGGMKAAKRRKFTDSVAALVILNRYLGR